MASSQQLAQLDRLERQVNTLVTAYQRLREELADSQTTVQQLQADVRIDARDQLRVGVLPGDPREGRGVLLAR